MGKIKGKTIGFIGGGQMAEAIFSGIIRSDSDAANNIIVSDINSDKLAQLEDKYGIKTVLNSPKDNSGAIKIAKECDIIFLAIKPQNFEDILKPIGSNITKDKLVISIVGAGSVEYIERFIKAPLIRVMPNIPMTVGEGIALLVQGTLATDDDLELAKEIFSLVGKSYVINEAMLDPMNGITGCGIAYIAMFIEAMADGGVKVGVPRDLAYELAAGVVSGTAKMVTQGSHPAVIKDKVCSPGGGTIAGVKALEDGAMRAAVMSAVEAGMKRMVELGKELADKE